MHSDEELMLAVGQGDLDKAAVLFDRHAGRLLRFFLHLGAEHELARDLVQNAFVRLIRYRTAFKPGHAFGPWLYQIARNVHHDHWGRQKLPTVRLRPAHEQVTGSAHEAAEQAEQEQQLRQALAQLPAEQRELLVLSRYQELKYDEIAQITGLSVSAVKVKIHRSIKRLRELFFAQNP